MPKEPQHLQSELQLGRLDTAESQQLRPSWTLLEETVQALGQDICLLIALTTLLPALWHLFHPIVGPSNGPSHGSNGVCVPPERDGIDKSPLEAVEGRGDLGVRLHAAQEAVDGSGHRFKGSNAIACREASTWGPHIPPPSMSPAIFPPLTPSQYSQFQAGL